MEIQFEIISRGTMQIKYGIRNAIVSGELTFQPPVFYADLNSLMNWETPYQNEKITEEDKNKIIRFLSNLETGTKIVFE